ncbi:histidinol phosphate phosphatase [Clostridium sp. MB40-C1]|uniref:histidinol phosphate phosphatase n=1 Tax=Clostridium sp. MB40-C1 TaxID=3070996 RepID=UPI0027DFBCA3|nr:histidinol phosphate phosphatase [Clostridium sp. MB40-C1]WMJ82442.1 histidinol phosphate phosphatase [Clostridium sp. MB40-C1]
MMFDTHMHGEFSTDSKMRIEEAINQSRKYNLGIIITDHMDLNFHDKSKFRFNEEEYFKKYNPFRDEKVLLGIEIGMSENYINDYEDICNNHPFDYVIGSVHDMYDIDLYYADELYKNNSKKEFYEEYFMQMVNSINTHSFIDSLGHIDYLSRCAKYEDKEMYYEEFKEHIDYVLKTLIDKGICIELNTRRLENEKAVNNLIKIYNRFKELGGKYITIGSDAHNVESIGKNFKTALEMVEYCQLKPVYFKNRQIQYD